VFAVFDVSQNTMQDKYVAICQLLCYYCNQLFVISMLLWGSWQICNKLPNVWHFWTKIFISNFLLCCFA